MSRNFCIFFLFESPKRSTPDLLGKQGVFSLFNSMVGREGFEPSKATPTDLQSVPFDHLGTPPKIGDNYRE